jgi:septin family protein
MNDEADGAEVPYLPLSIISPDIYEPGVIGRKFPWGFADPMDIEHCDFVRLKDAVFSEWRGELREASRELWYEGWRTSRLKHREVKPKR